jgi:hypothetical protein
MDLSSDFEGDNKVLGIMHEGFSLSKKNVFRKTLGCGISVEGWTLFSVEGGISVECWTLVVRGRVR